MLTGTSDLGKERANVDPVAQGLGNQIQLRIEEGQLCTSSSSLRQGLPDIPFRTIGVVLRDSHGVAQVKSVTGNKILR